MTAWQRCWHCWPRHRWSIWTEVNQCWSIRRRWFSLWNLSHVKPLNSRVKRWFRFHRTSLYRSMKVNRSPFGFVFLFCLRKDMSMNTCLTSPSLNHWLHQTIVNRTRISLARCHWRFWMRVEMKFLFERQWTIRLNSSFLAIRNRSSHRWFCRMSVRCRWQIIQQSFIFVGLICPNWIRIKACLSTSIFAQWI